VPDHRARFLQLALDAEALRFGAFTLKSGRESPYFFNAGRFDSGAALAALAACYADAIEAAGLDFDLLFGPAYKGIPLATALACEYARRGRDLPLAFDRKQAKAHGEGGRLIGAPLQGRRVLVIDDVITAGTAVRAALDLIAAAGGRAVGVAVALDRQERLDPDDPGPGGRRSAAQALADEHGLPVVAIAGLDDLLAFAGESADLVAHRQALLAYRARYGTGGATAAGWAAPQ
jgi:orotate phosphoribosyltransferase